MSSYIRKTFILREAEPVPEIASRVAEGMDNLADAIRTLAGVMASIAAGEHSNDYGSMRDMASVIYADAAMQFAELDGKMDPKRKDALDAWITGLCRGKKA